MISHYVSGISLTNPAFYSCLSSTSCESANGQLTFWYGTYFEPYRAPMALFIVASLYLAFHGFTLIAYIAVIFFLYVFAMWFLAKHLEIDPLIVFALLLSPVFLYTAVMAGSEEIISLAFLLIGLAFLYRRSPLFGLFLGLSALGKYPTLGLLPMILLLVKPKKIALAALLFVAITIPWLAFNQVYFHNAFTSYEFSMLLAKYNSQGFWLSPSAYASIFQYSAIFALVGIITVFGRRMELLKAVRKSILRKSIISKIYQNGRLYAYAIVLAFIILALAITLYIGPYYDTFTQTRYGYLLYTSSALLVSLLLSDARKYTKANLSVIVAALSFLFLSAVLIAYLLNSGIYVQYGSNNPAFAEATLTLDSFNFGNCRIVTNDWVSMIYRGVNAFPQFYYNATTETYPILIFHNQSSSTNSSFTKGLANATPAYSSTNYTLLLPQNWKCYG
ncbi:Uncharacterised protein [uncultured archaeon]|nr:Uncharacterised protein [uncultured archaeon]